MIHLMVVMFLLLKNDTLVLNMDLQKGLSGISLALKAPHQKKIDERERKNFPPKNKQINIIIAGDGLYSIPAPLPEHSAVKRKSKSGMNSRELLGVLNARADVNARNKGPRYPWFARKNEMEGTVILAIEVLPAGRAGRVQVTRSSGYSILDRAARSAAEKWIFFTAGEIDLPRPMVITRRIRFLIKGKNVAGER